MPPARSARRAATERACVECQRRKTRCIVKGEGACDHCSRAGKHCLFEEPQQRTPLTRQNLEVLENRCKELEALLQQYQQDRSRDTPSKKSERVPDPGSNGAGPYDWDEIQESPENEDVRDGMAALEGSGAGYLGPASAHDMLKTLRYSPVPEGRLTSRQETPVAANSLSQERPFLFANIQEHLVTAYFAMYNSCYPVLDERTFRAQCASRSRIPQASSWHITYYAVLAIGEWLLGGSGEQQSPYYECVRGRLNADVFESGSQNSVQAFLLLGNFLQKRDRPNTAYNMIGSAMRMAIGLGLHKEMSPTAKITPFERHRRRVLFWLVYCFDCWFNITTGRPALVLDTSFDVQIPSNIDDSNAEAAANGNETNLPTISSTTAALARLTKIAITVYEFISAPTCPDIDGRLSMLEHMITNWQRALPPYFFAHDCPKWFILSRQVIFWKQSNLLTLLLLSSQRHHKDDYERAAVGERCATAAASAIDDIAKFCESYAADMHAGIAWYAVYFSLQAMLCFTAQSMYKQQRQRPIPTGSLQSFEETASLVIRCLQRLRPISVPATRALRISLRLRDGVRKAAGPEHHAVESTALVRQEGQPAAFSGHPGIPEQTFVSPDATANMAQQTIPDFVMMEWETAADPSLQALFMNDFLTDQDFMDAFNMLPLPPENNM